MTPSLLKISTQSGKTKEKWSAKYIPNIKYSPYCTPILSDLFYKADAIAKYPQLNGVIGLFAYNPPMALKAIKEAGKINQIKIFNTLAYIFLTNYFQ